VRWLRDSAGVDASEAVFVSPHTSRSRDDPLPFASSAALELRKNSVPPASVAYCADGDCAGHRVKPGLPASAPAVSNCVTVRVGVLAASACFEKAYTWAPWKPVGGNSGYSLVVM
jgi:hypothetical protein